MASTLVKILLAAFAIIRAPGVAAGPVATRPRARTFPTLIGRGFQGGCILAGLPVVGYEILLEEPLLSIFLIEEIVENVLRAE